MNKEKVFTRLLRVSIISLLVISLFASGAYAAWDGSGSAPGTGGSYISGNYSLSASTVDAVYGYRFSIYDGNGDKLGHSIDMIFKADDGDLPIRSFKDYKKSHIDLYREYMEKGTIGTPGEKTTNSVDTEAAYVFYDTSLPTIPTDVETWLTPLRSEEIANMCGVQTWGSGTSYIICEPLFQARLLNERHLLTMAEFAVYQSTQYGWDVPEFSSPTLNTYSVIMRQLSAYFGRYLYATESYSVFGTSPVPESAFKKDANGTDSILLSDNVRYNAASDVLKYQMGMAVYTDVIPSYALTIDPNGGTYAGSSEVVTQEVLENAAITIENPVRPGYTFTGWTISNDSCSVNGNVYSHGEGPCTITAQWEPNESVTLDLNGLLDGVASDNIAGFGTFDVYINGELVADDVSDYNEGIPSGSTYEINDIKTNAGKTYVGLSSGNLTGTITANTEVVLEYTSNPYTLTVNPNSGAWVHNEIEYTDNHSLSMPHGTVLYLNDPVRPGYTFVGWMISNNTCQITDSEYKQGVGDCVITAIWEMDESFTALSGYFRFIEYRYLDTLDPDSKWRSEPLNELLRNTLSEDLSDTSNCEQVWHFSADEYEEVHEWCKDHDKGTQTNEDFLEEFKDNRIN